MVPLCRQDMVTKQGKAEFWMEGKAEDRERTEISRQSLASPYLFFSLSEYFAGQPKKLPPQNWRIAIMQSF